MGTLGTVWELPRLSDGFANQSFCWSDILRVQLKSKWTVGKSFLDSNSETVSKCRLISLEARLIFFICLFENSFISKELDLKEALDDVMLHYSDIQMALWTNHLVNQRFQGSNWSPTEQLVKDCLTLINHILIMQADFTLKTKNFFTMPNLKI